VLLLACPLSKIVLFSIGAYSLYFMAALVISLAWSFLEVVWFDPWLEPTVIVWDVVVSPYT
jgi:hypothetical protein